MSRIGCVALAATIGFAVAVTGCSDPDAILTEGEKLYSQNNEELIIRHFFQDRRGGTFVDVGAFHWKQGSTTLYLEKHLEWSGLALDAIPDLAAGYEKHRPRSRFLNFIVTDQAGGSETFFRAGAVSSTSREYVESVAPDNYTVIEVPTTTLDHILDAEGITKVDFLSMDIELGEPAALLGFDIERFRPDLVCIEAAPAVREPISSYFAEHGYVRINRYLEHDFVNWYFAPSGH